jgi:undecaprenyl-diphosphatase
MAEIFFWDHMIFGIINGMPHSPITDTTFRFLSGIGSFGIVWLLFGIILVIREDRKNHQVLKPLMFAALFSYVLSDVLFKPFVSRHRPDPLMGAIISGGELLSDYSFPSGHATAAFALATVLAFTKPKYRTAFYVLAILISFSRIYLGYHYPTDTIAGALLGYTIGKTVLMVFRRNSNKEKQKPRAA